MQCFLLLYIHKETLHLLMSNRQYYFGIHSTNDLNGNCFDVKKTDSR